MKTKRTRSAAHNSFLYIGGVLAALLTLMAVVSIFWTPYDPTAMDAMAKMAPPSPQHWLGTDNLGRDVLSRIMDGLGTSFVIAISVVAIG